MGDAEELRIAFSNVLDNAVKYSTRAIDIDAELLLDGGRLRRASPIMASAFLPLS